MADAEKTPEGAGNSKLFEAVALSERLIKATGGDRGRGEGGPGVIDRVRKTLDYWLWRLKGRKVHVATQTTRLAKALDHYGRDYEKALARIAELEAKLAERDRSAELVAEAERRTTAERVRAEAAEQALGHAQSRIEILKDALEVTKAAAKGGGSGEVTDIKFREAKRAFARLYHPDRGGDPTKHRLFAEFWPVLEKIEKGG
jgi:hypothetical protein